LAGAFITMNKDVICIIGKYCYEFKDGTFLALLRTNKKTFSILFNGILKQFLQIKGLIHACKNGYTQYYINNVTEIQYTHFLTSIKRSFNIFLFITENIENIKDFNPKYVIDFCIDNKNVQPIKNIIKYNPLSLYKFWKTSGHTIWTLKTIIDYHIDNDNCTQTLLGSSMIYYSNLLNKESYSNLKLLLTKSEHSSNLLILLVEKKSELYLFPEIIRSSWKYDVHSTLANYLTRTDRIIELFGIDMLSTILKILLELRKPDYISFEKYYKLYKSVPGFNEIFNMEECLISSNFSISVNTQYFATIFNFVEKWSTRNLKI